MGLQTTYPLRLLPDPSEPSPCHLVEPFVRIGDTVMAQSTAEGHREGCTPTRSSEDVYTRPASCATFNRITPDRGRKRLFCAQRPVRAKRWSVILREMFPQTRGGYQAARRRINLVAPLRILQL
jgi:hypothetical protein